MKATIQNFFAKLFGQTSGLNYINGPQTLPPPLSKEEEDALLALLPDEKARQTLVERNLRLVVYIAKRFESSGTGIEDLISIGTIGLMKAVSTFCPNKQIKLATYASRCIENEILMYLRKSAGQRTELSLDEPLNVDYDGNELLLGDMLGTESDDVCKELEKREEKRLIRKALDSLSERERLIIELRFGFCTNGGKEKTQKEVADLLGISQSYISRLEKKIIERLKELLEKEGCS